MKGFLREFETFLLRGNAADLAFGVVIGAAFSQVTTALASGILTPPLGLLFGGANLAHFSIPIGNGLVIAYGAFLQAAINFILIAFALFLLVKLFNSLAAKRRNEEKKPSDTAELKVLLEIRDELHRRT